MCVFPFCYYYTLLTLVVCNQIKEDEKVFNSTLATINGSLYELKQLRDFSIGLIKLIQLRSKQKKTPSIVKINESISQINQQKSIYEKWKKEIQGNAPHFFTTKEFLLSKTHKFFFKKNSYFTTKYIKILSKIIYFYKPYIFPTNKLSLKKTIVIYSHIIFI